MFLLSIFWVISVKVTYTREALDFWSLHKNKNCAFPLKIFVKDVLTKKIKDTITNQNLATGHSSLEKGFISLFYR